MRVQKLIAGQKGRPWACRPDDSVRRAAAILGVAGVGALPVCDGANHLLGVLSERDIVRGIAITDAIRLMFQHKIRHLPVMDGTDVAGMISLRAAMEARLRSRRWRGTAKPQRPTGA